MAGVDELRREANCISVSPQSKRTASSTAARVATLGRKLLWASLALAPITILLRFVFDAGDTALFVARRGRTRPARVVDRRGDRARGRAHGPRGRGAS